MAHVIGMEFDMRLLRYSELRERGVPWSRMHIDRLEKAGRFPRRVRLGDRTVGWIESEIDALMAERIAQRERADATAA
jgi:prophage regulatory protein